MHRRLLLLLALSFAALAQAAAPSYDETADARAEVHQALAASQGDRRPVLLIFGANWCEDCRALDKSLRTGRNPELIGG